MPLISDCTNTLEVRQGGCDVFNDAFEQITFDDSGTLTTNFAGKPVALMVKEKVNETLLALGIDYLWADATDRNAQAGMVAGEDGYQDDTKEIYRYDGATWNLRFNLTQVEFLDSTFKIKNSVDETKVLDVDVSLIDTATTRTLTMPNKDTLIGDERQALSVIHNITVDTDYTLTTEQNLFGRVEITDTNPFLTIARNIILNNIEHTFLFVNNTLQDLTVKNSTGTGITVVAGDKKELRNNTVDVIEFEGAAVSLLGTLDINNMIHIQDQKTSGTNAGSSISGTQIRVLNTVLTNTILGASLSANQIILPAGNYLVVASSPALRVREHRNLLYNVTDASIEALGTSEFSGDSYIVVSRSFICKPFTIAGAKTFELRHYTNDVELSHGLGRDVNDGSIEIYADIKIWKVG